MFNYLKYLFILCVCIFVKYNKYEYKLKDVGFPSKFKPIKL